MIQIKIEGDLVNFYDDDKDSPIYTIIIAKLPITRTEKVQKNSEWIDDTKIEKSIKLNFIKFQKLIFKSFL